MFHPNRQAVRPTDPYQSRTELTPAGQQAVADVQMSMMRDGGWRSGWPNNWPSNWPSGWHELHGVSPYGFGATPTLASDGVWYCAVPVGVGQTPRVMRYGLGDVSSDIEVFNSAIDIGDGFMANGQYQQAVQSYQSAGDTGVNLIGPDIDNLTGGASKGLTQQAWEINKNLHSSQINTGPDASVGDAQSAQGFIGQMQNLYAQGATLTPTGGAGIQPSANLVSAAQSLTNYISANGCNGSQDIVKTFQTAYDAEGQIILKIDGKYGPLTAAAVQRVLDAGGGGTAPPACHFSGGGGGSKTTVASSTPSSGHAWLPWVIGGAVVAAGGLALVAHNKKRR